MMYDAYKTKVQKAAAVRRRIWKFRVPILVACVLLVASVVTLLCLKGNITRGATVSAPQVYYGDDYEVGGAKAMLGGIAGYEYRLSGEEKWSKQKPVKAGDYEVRAVSRGAFGKKRSRAVSFVILPRPVTVSVLSNLDENERKLYDVTYGDNPRVDAPLAGTDALVASALTYTLDDCASLTATASVNVDSVRMQNAAGEDVTDCYVVTAQSARVAFSPRPISVRPIGMQSVYGDNAVYAGGADESTLDDLVFGAKLSFAAEIADSRNNAVEIPVSAGVYTVRVQPGSVRITVDGKDATACYLPTAVDNSIVIDRRALTVTTANAEKTYDGVPIDVPTQPEKAVGVLPTHTFVLTGETPYVRNYTAGVPNTSRFAVQDESGEDVTDNYAISYEYGTLAIARATVSVTTANDGKTYDGTALQCFDFTNSPLYAGDTISLDFTRERDFASRTDAGATANVLYFAVKDASGDISDNYTIEPTFGTLTVTAKTVTVHASPVQYPYDGMQKDNSFAVADGVLTGHYCVVYEQERESYRNVRRNEYGDAVAYEKTYTAAQYDIRDGQGNSVRGNYNIISVTGNANVTILPASLDVFTGSAEKVFDGTVLTVADETFVTQSIRFDGLQGDDKGALANLASLLSPDRADNVCDFTITDGNGRIEQDGHKIADNYTVRLTYGTLTVTPRPVKITMQSASRPYDGTPLTQTGFDCEGTAPIVGYELQVRLNVRDGELCAQTDAGSCDNAYAADKFEFTYVSSDGGSYDATGWYTVTVEKGTLTVDKCAVVVRAEDATAVYDGAAYAEPISWHCSSGSFVGAQTPALSWVFQDSTPQIVSPVDAGAYRITLNGVSDNGDFKASNYDISYSLPAATLTVSPRDVYVQTTNATKVYNGKDSFDVASDAPAVVYATSDPLHRFVGSDFPVFELEYFVEGVSVSPVDCGTYVVHVAHLQTPTYYDSNYCVREVQEETHYLTITERTVTITVHGASKTYDGQPLVALDSTADDADNIAEGHTLCVVGTRSRLVDYTDGGITNMTQYAVYDGERDVTFNYTVQYIRGVLLVNKRTVHVFPVFSKIYDGTEDFTLDAISFNEDESKPDKCFVKGQTPVVTKATYESDGAHKNTGEYFLSVELESSDTCNLNNYTIYSPLAEKGAVRGVLRVNRRTVYVRPKGGYKEYDGKEYDHAAAFADDIGWEYGGSSVDNESEQFVGDERPLFLWGYLTEDGWPLSSAPVDVGKYFIRISGHEAIEGLGGYLSTNYNVQSTSANLTIAPRKIVVSRDDKEKPYDGEALYGDTATADRILSEYFHELVAVDGTVTSIVNVRESGKAIETQFAVFAGTGEKKTDVTHNYEISYAANGASLTVTPRTVYIQPHANKMYDGGEDFVVLLENIYPDDCDAQNRFVDGEVPALTWRYVHAGEHADAGEYAVCLHTVVGSDSCDVNNYSISGKDGTLIVSPRTVYVQPSGEKAYDGTSDIVVNSIYAASTEEENKFVGKQMPTFTYAYADGNADAGAHKNVLGGPYAIVVAGVAWNETCKESNYTLAYGTGTLTVTRRVVYIAALDDEKVYDGKTYERDLTNFADGRDWKYTNESVSDETAQFVSGELPSFTWAYHLYEQQDTQAEPINAGKYLLTHNIGYDSPTADNDFRFSNYDIRERYEFGVLTIRKRTLCVQSESKDNIVYDGEWHTFTGVTDLPEKDGVVYDGLAPEQHFVATVQTQVRDVTKADGVAVGVPNEFESTIYGSNGEDVTDNYTITSVCGTLTVVPRTVYLAPQLYKTYDGTDSLASAAFAKLYAEDTAEDNKFVDGSPAFTFAYKDGGAEGTHKNVSGSPYALALSQIAWQEPRLYDNYTVVCDGGALTVAPRRVVVSLSGEKTYDGTADYTVAVSVTEGGFLANETPRIVVESISPVNVGTYDLVYKDALADGNDFLAENYEIVPNGVGTYTVYARPLAVRSGDAARDYDGEGVFNGTVTSEEESEGRGLLRGHDVRVEMYPVITDVAQSYENNNEVTVSIWDGDTNVTGNYAITLAAGTLTVRPRALTITRISDEKEYDGTALRGAKATADALLSTHELRPIDGTVSELRNVLRGEDGSVLTMLIGTLFAVWEGETDRTGNYTISYALDEKGSTLKLLPRSVEIVPEDGEKTFDGTADYTVPYHTVGSFVNGETPELVWAYQGENGGTEPFAPDAYTVSFVKAQSSDTCTVDNYEITCTQTAQLRVSNDILLYILPKTLYYSAKPLYALGDEVTGYVRGADKSLVGGAVLTVRVSKIELYTNGDNTAVVTQAETVGKYRVWYEWINKLTIHGTEYGDLDWNILNKEDEMYFEADIQKRPLYVRPAATTVPYEGETGLFLGTADGAAAEATAEFFHSTSLAEGNVFTIVRTDSLDVTKESTKQIGIVEFTLTDADGKDVSSNYDVYCHYSADDPLGYTERDFQGRLMVQRNTLTVTRKAIDGKLSREERTFVYDGNDPVVPYEQWKATYGLTDNDFFTYEGELSPSMRLQVAAQCTASPGTKSTWLKVRVIDGDKDVSNAFRILYVFEQGETEGDDEEDDSRAKYGVFVTTQTLAVTCTVVHGETDGVPTQEYTVTVKLGENVLAQSADGYYELYAEHRLRIAGFADDGTPQIEVYTVSVRGDETVERPVPYERYYTVTVSVQEQNATDGREEDGE